MKIPLSPFRKAARHELAECGERKLARIRIIFTIGAKTPSDVEGSPLLVKGGQGGFYSEIKRNIFLQFAIKPALRKSLRQISENAGYEGFVVLNKVLDGNDDDGFNAQTEKFETTRLRGGALRHSLH